MSVEEQNPLATQKISSLILKFTIPAIISMMVSSLYNIVDQIFIGQGVGMLGNAATNIAFPVNIICTAVAWQHEPAFVRNIEGIKGFRVRIENLLGNKFPGR